MSLLEKRLQASPEEVAAWVFLGPDDGGLAAYTNANELDPPPRFRFPSPTDAGHSHASGYTGLLMWCWFKSEDVETFEPADRFITGAALVKSWSQIPVIVDAVEYLRAKICESRLCELHPIWGLTQATLPDEADRPHYGTGLFRQSEVRAVEREDFLREVTKGAESPEERRSRLKKRCADVKNSGEKAFLLVVAEEERISISRLKQLIKPPSPEPRQPASWADPVSRKSKPV